MAISVIASTSAGSGDDANVTTSAINTTGATGIFLIVSSDTLTPPGYTISDNKGNGAPVDSGVAVTITGGAGAVRLWYYLSPSVGSGHTFTVTSSTKYPAVAVLAVSGLKLTSPLDVSAVANSATQVTSQQPGSVTPTENDELLVLGITWDLPTSGYAISGGFTVAASHAADAHSYGGGLGYKIQTTAGAENPSWSWTSAAATAIVIASFKSAAAANVTISRTDAITVSDTIKLNLLLKPKLTDAITATEIIKLNLLLKPKPTETVTVSEAVKLNLRLKPKLSEILTVTETIKMRVLLKPTRTDAVTLSETIKMNLLLKPKPTESVTVSDSIKVNVVLKPKSSDPVTLTETVRVTVSMRIQRLDSVGVSDSASVVGPSSGFFVSVSVQDTITLSETVRLSLLLKTSAIDALTVTETITLNVLLRPTASETLTVSDSITLNVVLKPKPTDAVSVSETSITRVLVNPKISEAITVTETVKMQLLLMPAVMDLLNLSDLGTVQLVSPMSPVFVGDLVIVSDSARIRVGGGRGNLPLLPVILVG